MMPVKVCIKLLGSFRKLLPPDVDDYKFEVEIPTGTTLSDLMTPYNVPLTKDTVFLVNGLSPRSLHQILVDGDTIAAFSAMAGG